MKIRSIKGFNMSIFVSLLTFSFLMLPFFNVIAQEKPQYGGILRIAEQSGPGDAIGIPWEMRGPSVVVLQPAFEALIRVDDAKKIHPLLATSWEIAPDNLSLTFTLRKGVKFHDGSDFNAEVAAWNLQQKLDHKDRGTNEWKSIEIIDDYTIRINLKKYNNYLLENLRGRETSMLSKEAYEKKGEEWCRHNPVGTGPFVFESHKRDQILKFKRNNNYWNKGLPYLDSVELLFIKDFMTQQAALQTGELDVLGAETGKIVADLRDKGFKVASGNTGSIVMVPDSKNAESPYSKKQVREAVSYAIDREAIVKARGFGFWSPGYQLPYKGVLGYIPDFQGRRYDPEKAKQLLKDAGYPNGFETRIIPMAFGTDMNVFVAIQAYLKEVGIETKVENVPMSKFTDYRFNGWHNGLLAQPFGFENMAYSSENYFSEKLSKIQYPVLKRPDGFQELLEECVTTRYPDEAKLQKLNRLIFDDALVIPLHTTGRAFIYRDNVHATGHMQWGGWLDWRPDEAWKSK